MLNFFRTNETAYLVMRYEHGRTLQEHIRHHHGGIKEDFIRRVFTLLLNGLRKVHANKLMHLDIKPANIYIRNDGSPLLIDFGAARQTLAEEAMRLNPTHTPGFASPEHCSRREPLGPWSDIYSIGASMFSCLAAAAPQATVQRLDNDRYISAKKLWGGKYSAQLLETMDWCLRLDQLERPQSVFALQKALMRERDPAVSKFSRASDLRSMVLKLASWRVRR